MKHPEHLDHAQPNASRSSAGFFRLQGGCMRLLIKDGEILPITPLAGRKPRSGDVVLYESGGKRHLHRVWWRRPGRVWLKDDTGVVPFHTIPERKVLGLLEDRRPLSRGWPGLFYSLVSTTVFIFGRRIKSVLRISGRSTAAQHQRAAGPIIKEASCQSKNQ